MLEAIWPNRCATVETRNVSYYDDESTPVTNICRHCRWLRDVVNTASASELFAGRKRESNLTQPAVELAKYATTKFELKLYKNKKITARE